MTSAMLEVLWECSGSEKCDDSEEYGCARKMCSGGWQQYGWSFHEAVVGIYFVGILYIGCGRFRTRWVF